MKKALFSKKTVVMTVIFFIVELILGVAFVYSLAGRLSCTYKTTATIDFIGLPDGTVFVSCYDENDVFHEDVKLDNVYKRGDIEYIESFYGKEIPVYLSSQGNRAVSVSAYYADMTKVIIVPLIYGAVMILRYKKLRSNK